MRRRCYPDVEQLLRATEELVRDGFVVLPYCNDDPVSCRKLADAGGGGDATGFADRHRLRHLQPVRDRAICTTSAVPVILDAGIGTASDAAQAMDSAATACC